MMKVLNKLAAVDAKTKAGKAAANAKTKADANSNANDAAAAAKTKSDAKAAAEWKLMCELFGDHSDSEEL